MPEIRNWKWRREGMWKEEALAGTDASALISTDGGSAKANNEEQSQISERRRGGLGARCPPEFHAC
jgi:hypothetical protein